MAHNLSVQSGSKWMEKNRGILIYRPSFKFYYTLVKLFEIASVIFSLLILLVHFLTSTINDKDVWVRNWFPFSFFTQLGCPQAEFFAINSHRETRQRRFNFDSSGKHFQHWHWIIRYFTVFVFLCTLPLHINVRRFHCHPSVSRCRNKNTSKICHRPIYLRHRTPGRFCIELKFFTMSMKTNLKCTINEWLKRRQKWQTKPKTETFKQRIQLSLRWRLHN